jgi:hypothetical protein
MRHTRKGNGRAARRYRDHGALGAIALGVAACGPGTAEVPFVNDPRLVPDYNGDGFADIAVAAHSDAGIN